MKTKKGKIMEKLNQLKSINYNDVLDKKEIKKDLEAHFNKPLIYIEGLAYSTITHMTKYGENTGFKGKFMAMNHITGEVFEAKAAFLPKNLTEDLVRILDKNGEVKVQATIQIMPSDKNSDGFAWVAEEPQTEARQNAEDALTDSFLNNIKGLTALEKPKEKAA